MSSSISNSRSSTLSASQVECSICTDENSLETVLETVCQHLFHRKCLIPAIKQRNACPNCNTENPLGDRTVTLIEAWDHHNEIQAYENLQRFQNKYWRYATKLHEFLYEAYKTGNPKHIQPLLNESAKALLYERGQEGRTVLLECVYLMTYDLSQGQVLFEPLQQIIKKGARNNEADDKGNTALHIAALTMSNPSKGQLNHFKKIITTLLNHGADINAENNEGETPLNIVASFYHGAENQQKLMEFFLSHGAKVNFARFEKIVNDAGKIDHWLLDHLLVKGVKYSVDEKAVLAANIVKKLDYDKRGRLLLVEEKLDEELPFSRAVMCNEWSIPNSNKHGACWLHWLINNRRVSLIQMSGWLACQPWKEVSQLIESLEGYKIDDDSIIVEAISKDEDLKSRLEKARVFGNLGVTIPDVLVKEAEKSLYPKLKPKKKRPTIKASSSSTASSTSAASIDSLHSKKKDKEAERVVTKKKRVKKKSKEESPVTDTSESPKAAVDDDEYLTLKIRKKPPPEALVNLDFEDQ